MRFRLGELAHRARWEGNVWLGVLALAVIVGALFGMVVLGRLVNGLIEADPGRASGLFFGFLFGLVAGLLLAGKR